MSVPLKIGKLYRVKSNVLPIAIGTPGIDIKFYELHRGDIAMYLGKRKDLLKFLYGEEFIFCWPPMEEDEGERWELV